MTSVGIADVLGLASPASGYPERVAEYPEQLPASFQVTMPEDMVGGVWANYAQVSHSPYEFTLDFVRLDFSQPSDGKIPGRVVTRVNLSPLLIAQLIEALNDNWQKYAERAMPQEVRDAGRNDDVQ